MDPSQSPGFALAETRAQAIIDLKAELSATEVKLEQAGQVGLGLLARIKTLEDKEAEHVEQLVRQADEATAQTRRIHQLERILETREQDTARITAELDEAQQMLDEARASARAAKQAQKSAASVALERSDSSLQHQREAEQVAEQLLALQTENRKLKAQLREKSDEIRGLEDFNAQLQSTASLAEQKVSGLESRLVQLRNNTKEEAARVEAGNQREMEMARDKARLVLANQRLSQEVERLRAVVQEAESLSRVPDSPALSQALSPQNSLLMELEGQLDEMKLPKTPVQPPRTPVHHTPVATPVKSAGLRDHVDAAREFFYMSVQTVIIARTNPSQMSRAQQAEEKLEQLEKSFRTAAALAEASGAYEQPHMYALYKQATEGLCPGEKPSIWQQTKRRRWAAWKSLGEMSTQAAMQQYVDLVSMSTPGWCSPVSIVPDGDADKAAYYYLTHEAIDGMYQHAQRTGVPMQDWHSWIQKRLDSAVEGYLKMDEAQVSRLKQKLVGLEDSWRLAAAGETNVEDEAGSEVQQVNSQSDTRPRLERADSATVIAAMLSGDVSEHDLAV